MTLLETFKTALIALRLNKVRSFLTMLGVIIGVFSVVVLVSTVKGLENYITDQFNALGSNLILVSPGSVSGGDPARSFASNKLDVKHLDLIKSYVGDSIVAVTGSIRLGKDVRYKTRSYNTTIVGTTYELAEIMDIKIESGRFFNKSDQETKSSVVVLGPTIVKELFTTRSPIGQNIKIDSHSFTVVGVFESKGPNFDDRVYLPYTTARNSFGVSNFSSFALKAKPGADVEVLMKQVELALLRDLKKDDFSVLSQKDILATVGNILNVLSIGLGAIAGISLLVGGIGIMNIMLVSVTERTREIGLRKALGATSKNIGIQFLIESTLLSITGGLLGLFFGWVMTIVVQPYLRAEVPWWAIVMALGFSTVVGVGFGTYPAISASKKDPIEALRYE